MTQKEFRDAFGSLYQNIDASKQSAYVMTFLFCCKCILISLSTVLATEYMFVSVYAYCFSSLFYMGFVLSE